VEKLASVIFPSEGQLHLTLEQTGPLIRVSITVPVLRKRYLEANGLTPHPSINGFALVDTGAGLSAVDDRVMSELEIPPVNDMETITPHGLSVSNMYNASANFSDFGMVDISLEGCLGCYLGESLPEEPRIIMLLGRDLLRRFVLTYDGPAGRATIHL
jgi:hypothetical protein